MIRFCLRAVLVCALVLAVAVLLDEARVPLVSSASTRPADLSKVMGNIDTWAGLSTPSVQPKPSLADSRRAEAKVCLALNAYYESRGESYEGQVAVGQVALRRAGLDHRRVCAEIYKPGQFSWTATRPRHGALPSGVAWQWALAAAEESLRWATYPERMVDHSRGATFYAHARLNPYWAAGLKIVASIDNHIFYR